MGNNYPGKSGLIELESFPLTKVHARVKTFHTFGFPCFTLDPKFFQKKSIPKWTPQSRQAFYLGILPQHVASATLPAKGIWVSTLLLGIDLLKLV